MKYQHIMALVALPQLLLASGFGFSVPINIIEKEKIYYATDNVPNATYDYKPSTGLGFVFDTNIGKPKDFGYRLNLEYSYADIDSSSRDLYSDFSKHKYSVINTFGFALHRSENMRFWVGPRVLLQLEYISSGSNIRSQRNYGAGIAFATGINVNVAKKISLGADIDYHAVYMLGGENYGASIDDSSSYTLTSGSNKGVTAHFYLLFRFGEQYNESSVIDHSL